MVFDSGTYRNTRSQVTSITGTKSTTVDISLQGIGQASRSGTTPTATPVEDRDPSLKWAIHEDV